MEEKLKDLIYDICKVDVNKMTPEEKEYPLLSRKFGVMPYQMLVLFVKVEDIFKITISEKVINLGEFNSYNDIWKVVSSGSADALRID